MENSPIGVLREPLYGSTLQPHTGLAVPFFAHLENGMGSKHDVVTYRERAAERAASFAAKFGAAEFHCWAGLRHDIEKFHPDFQTSFIFLTSRRESDHSTAEQDRP